MRILAGAFAGLTVLSLLLTPVAVHATSYTATITLTAPGGQVIWTLTKTVETSDSTLVLQVPQRLYDLIVDHLGTDTFTTPFSVSLPGGFTLTVSSVPSGLTLKFTPIGMGDVVVDGQVNILDAASAAFSYGVGPGAPNYNAYADLNIDGRINILDLALLALSYGKSY